MARVAMELPEVDIYDFEKIKYKNFKNWVDPGLRTTRGG
jgi:hypothetical protein